MSEIELAYIAGLIDGEAYIGIKKTITQRNGRVNPQYQERIQVRMVSEDAIKFLAETLGGNYYKEPPNSKRGRPLFCFQASDQQAVNILAAILPYLRIKRDVALMTLELRKRKDNPDKITTEKRIKTRWGSYTTVKRWRHSPKEIAERERLYKKCKSLNVVGIR